MDLFLFLENGTEENESLLLKRVDAGLSGGCWRCVLYGPKR